MGTKESWPAAVEKKKMVSSCLRSKIKTGGGAAVLGSDGEEKKSEGRGAWVRRSNGWKFKKFQTGGAAPLGRMRQVFFV